jgi:hypothetical protein
MLYLGEEEEAGSGEALNIGHDMCEDCLGERGSVTFFLLLKVNTTSPAQTTISKSQWISCFFFFLVDYVGLFFLKA